jgi:hypothetical protein
LRSRNRDSRLTSGRYLQKLCPFTLERELKYVTFSSQFDNNMGILIILHAGVHMLTTQSAARYAYRRVASFSCIT